MSLDGPYCIHGGDNKMTLSMWEYIERGYYLTLENCSEGACNGEIMLDEIIRHYIDESNEKGDDGDKSIIIDIYLLSELNWNEFMKLRKREEFYTSQGFSINYTF